MVTFMVMFKVEVWSGLTKGRSVRVVSVPTQRLKEKLDALIELAKMRIRTEVDLVKKKIEELIRHILEELFKVIAEGIFEADNVFRGEDSIVIEGGEWSLSARDVFIAETKLWWNGDYYIIIKLQGRYCNVGTIGSIEVEIRGGYKLHAFAQVDYCKVW